MFHILVANNDKKSSRKLCEVLKCEGYSISTVSNGEEALKVIDKEYIDLVILDTHMHKMDGFEFTKILREVNNNMPIIMIATDNSRENLKRGFLAGTDDYMQMPVDTEELVLRIKALLRRAEIATERKIIFNDIILDYDTLTVSKGEIRQTLAQKEFLLLYKLLSYPGKIFTRIQLMDEIWGSESNSGWETVTVHIGRLRKRFKNWKDFDIQSVRGLGYRAIRNDD